MTRRKETRRQDTWFREVGCTGKDKSPANRPIIEAKVKKLERILVAVQKKTQTRRGAARLRMRTEFRATMPFGSYNDQRHRGSRHILVRRSSKTNLQSQNCVSKGRRVPNVRSQYPTEHQNLGEQYTMFNVLCALSKLGVSPFISVRRMQ